MQDVAYLCFLGFNSTYVTVPSGKLSFASEAEFGAFLECTHNPSGAGVSVLHMKVPANVSSELVGYMFKGASVEVGYIPQDMFYRVCTVAERAQLRLNMAVEDARAEALNAGMPKEEVAAILMELATWQDRK